MLPRLHELSPVQKKYLHFLDAVSEQGFSGDLNPDYANRTVLATDNSIYQVLPQAVVYPADESDIQTLLKLSASDEWQDIVLSPRGGGTGTNGQSLTDGIVVDLSKHMNKILEINVEERWVRVQTGVVKDQLNKALAPYRLFFAPELSTSNRATIGGMINTDASGQGSVMYGKTRDHVLNLRTAILGGEVVESHPLTSDELKSYTEKTDRIGQLHATVNDVYQRRKDDIIAKFPPLNRCLTGYDLAHIVEDDKFNLNSVLCGSEGTLGFITEAKLNLLVEPNVSALVNVFYDSFEASLRDAQTLMGSQPTSIETVDSTVLNLAKDDIIWHSVSEYFTASADSLQGVNFVEFTADSEQALNEKIERLTTLLAEQAHQPMKNIGHSVTLGTSEVNKIWAMRKKSVGLLGNAKGEARPVAFVEDTAVSPEHLADFIMEFRAVLDAHQLRYGMFGHVDAGVLHVRPALDIKSKKDEAMVRTITDQVVELVKRYNGLLWGEHGKGVRSEFSPAFFGDLYPELQAIKRAFDPFDQLNRGKISTSHNAIPLLKIDEVPTRGSFDRTILPANWSQFAEGMYCNGNGACFNFDPDDAMCPSWKITRERKNSPKGRASLIREWVRLLSEQNVNTETLKAENDEKRPLAGLWTRIKNTRRKAQGEYDFSHEVAESMSACLACKSCKGQCPIKVDVPQFRSEFLNLYHTRYLRPAKDYLVGTTEYLMPLIALEPFKGLYNALMGSNWLSQLLANKAGLVDSPQLSGFNHTKELRKRGVEFANARTLNRLSDREKERSVILVQDAFTSYFETPVFLDIVDFLQTLNFRVWVMPFTPNGKPLHVHGFLKAFNWTAQRNLAKRNALANTGVAMVGIDPAMTLTYRGEYQTLDNKDQANVALLQEFLVERLDWVKQQATSFKPNQATFLGHCTEKTNAPASSTQWRDVFEALNQTVNIQPVGCCGMAGTFGHETKNKDNSVGLYDLSWRTIVEANVEKNDSETAEFQNVIATGYSCRSQAKRLSHVVLSHPLQFLLGQYQPKGN